MAAGSESKVCPQCGKGRLVEVTYRQGSPDEVDEPIQTADTRQVETYSCGHEVVGPRLAATSAEEGLDAEHRTSEETVDPP